MADLARLLLESANELSQEEVDSLIRSYRKRAPDYFDSELLRHFILAHAVDAAHSALFSTATDSSLREIEIRKYLSTAFRWKLSASTPFVIVVYSPEENSFFRELAKSIASFIDAPRLSLTEGLGSVLNLNKLLEKNSALVVELCAANVLRKHEVGNDLKEQGLNPFFVRCEPNQEMVLTGLLDEGASSSGESNLDIFASLGTGLERERAAALRPRGSIGSGSFKRGYVKKALEQGLSVP